MRTESVAVVVGLWPVGFRTYKQMPHGMGFVMGKIFRFSTPSIKYLSIPNSIAVAVRYVIDPGSGEKISRCKRRNRKIRHKLGLGLWR